MDWPKVKTILLVFLLFINLVLGAAFASRTLESARIEREAVGNALAVFRRLGVDVGRELLEMKTPKLYTMEIERDKELEKAAFSAIIGAYAAEDLGSGILKLEGAGGVARLSGSGIFELKMNGGSSFETPAAGVEAALFVLGKMGIADAEDQLSSRETDGGYVVEGIQMINGRMIFNRKYEMHFDARGLCSMQGGRILGRALVCDATPSVSVVTALIAFIDEMEKSGTPCLRIEGAELGYYARASAPGYTQIIPVWEIESDLGIRYLNAVDLELIRELPK